MIQQDKLDEAVRMAATRMDAKEPRKVLLRWLNYFPPSMQQFIITKYRKLITTRPT